MVNKEILDSWKSISDYLDRDIRTCFRWEKELGLPIYRIDKDSSRSKVFAYKSEIDKWLKEKSNNIEIKKKSFLEKKWAKIGLISSLALLSIILFLLFKNMISISPSPGNLSIAALPFESLNFSEYEVYIPEGISNEIINSLTRQNKLKVINLASVAGHNKFYKSTKQIGEQLEVDYILKGKIEKYNNKIIIYAQLIRTKDDKNIWDEKFEDRLENIFSMHENICLKIYKKLNLNNYLKLPFPSKNGETADYTAFDNYLKGNHILKRLMEENNDPWKLYHLGKYYQGKFTQESNEFAINLFSQAIESDNNFVRAYIGLARCYANYVNFNWDYNEEWLNKAEELLKKVQAISTYYPEYYSALIQVYLLKYFCFNKNTKKIAFELAQEIIKKYPDHLQLYSIVGYCYYLKFGEDGNKEDFDKALELNEENFYFHPNHINNITYAELLMLNREFDRAILVSNMIKESDSSLMANFRKGEIYYYMGDLDKSESIFRQFESSLDFKISSLFYLGMIASQKRDIEEVERIIQKIDIIAPKKFNLFEDQLKLASIYMGIGKKELGYGCLKSFFSKEKTHKIRFIYHKYIEIDKNFENFREEEKFKKIIKKKEE